jgi:hypothetical protein
MSITPQEISYQETHANEDIGYQLVIPIAIWLVLGLVTLAMRIYARSTTKIGLGPDDYLLAAAMVGLPVWR